MRDIRCSKFWRWPGSFVCFGHVRLAILHGIALVDIWWGERTSVNNGGAHESIRVFRQLRWDLSAFFVVPSILLLVLPMKVGGLLRDGCNCCNSSSSSSSLMPSASRPLPPPSSSSSGKALREDRRPGGQRQSRRTPT